MSQYDPDAPEGARPPSAQYWSLKDIRVIAIVLVVLGFLIYPIFRRMEMDGKLKVCKGNIEQVSKAVLLYSAQNDDRFPPAFAEEGPGIPYQERGVPYTWVSIVQPLLSKQGDFGCPVADPSELCENAAPTNGASPIRSAFGMTAGMATEPIGLLDAPTDTVFLAESANSGAKSTYNPVPFMTMQGVPMKNDGFLIGYDNSPGGNVEADATTMFMTRLAFYNAGNSDYFGKDVEPRHDGGLFIIFTDGHLGRMAASDAEVVLLHDEPQGYWRTK